MYCKMLNEAVRKRKGTQTQEEQEDFTTSIDLDVDAFIPTRYILNEEQKLEIYKRIAGIENQGEADDMRDELVDRFGEVPESVDNLLRIAVLRSRAHHLYMVEIKGGNGEISMEVSRNAHINSAFIPELLKQFGQKLSFRTSGKPLFLYRYKKSDQPENAERELLCDAENIIKAMEDSLLQKM